jgi:hypothetical protein
MSFFMMMMENLQLRQQATLPRGKKGFRSRLQSTAGCSIATVQSGQVFLEFKAAVSNAAWNNFYYREG